MAPIILIGAAAMPLFFLFRKKAVMATKDYKPSKLVPGAFIKNGVDESRLRPECLRALEAIVSIVQSHPAWGPVVVTSTYEGTHLPTSLHYKNLAFDLRSFQIKGEAMERRPFSLAIASRIGRGYDVLNEGTGAGYDRQSKAPHIHIEWDPKQAGTV